MRIVFDPAVISFAELLSVFWESHNPGHSSSSRQYRSAILYENPEQRGQALKSLLSEEQAQKEKILTDLSPLGTFYPAEEYHQKYYLRSHQPLLEELGRLYPDFSTLRTTTLAARTNGFLGGHLTLEEYDRELRTLGLGEKERERILRVAKDRRR